MLSLVTGNESASSGDHTPPREWGGGPGEERADCPRRPREAGLAGDLAVGDHLTPAELPEDPGDLDLKRRHRVRVPPFLHRLRALGTPVSAVPPRTMLLTEGRLAENENSYRQCRKQTLTVCTQAVTMSAAILSLPK